MSSWPAFSKSNIYPVHRTTLSIPIALALAIMSSNAVDQASPARSTIIVLDKPSDWDEWLFLLKRKANNHDIWQYINPEEATQPALPEKPTLPDAKTVDASAQSIQALTAD